MSSSSIYYLENNEHTDEGLNQIVEWRGIKDNDEFDQLIRDQLADRIQTGEWDAGTFAIVIADIIMDAYPVRFRAEVLWHVLQDMHLYATR